MKRDILLSLLVGIAFFFFLSSALASSLHAPVTVSLVNEGLDGEVRVCPPDIIYDDVRYAVEEWNKAITYFGLRYIWLDVLSKRLRISSDECNVRFEFVEFRELKAGCKDVGDLMAVSVTSFDGDGATIHIWKGLVGQDIKDVLRRVLIHEFSWVLGIHPPVTVVETAASPTGSLKVTSLDIYALHARSMVDFNGRKVVNVDVPQNIPFITVERGLAYDCLIALASAFISLLSYKLLKVVEEWPI
jgi:hypothetical protein